MYILSVFLIFLMEQASKREPLIGPHGVWKTRLPRPDSVHSDSYVPKIVKPVKVYTYKVCCSFDGHGAEIVLQ